MKIENLFNINILFQILIDSQLSQLQDYKFLFHQGTCHTLHLDRLNRQFPSRKNRLGSEPIPITIQVLEITFK